MGCVAGDPASVTGTDVPASAGGSGLPPIARLSTRPIWSLKERRSSNLLSLTESPSRSASIIGATRENSSLATCRNSSAVRISGSPLPTSLIPTNRSWASMNNLTAKSATP